MKDEDKKSMLDSITERFEAFKKKLGFTAEPTKLELLVKFAKERDEKIKPEKFEELMLADGTTKIVIEPAVEIGAYVVLYNQAGEPVPAPSGEYELENGNVIIVEEEGIIADIRELVEEGEVELSDESKSDAPKVDEKVKRTIERIETEKIFESITALKKQVEEQGKTIAFLKEENETLKSEMVNSQKENLESFKKLLGEPVKEPAVKKPNTFKVSDFNSEDILQSWLAKHNND